jgi:cytochrome c oxidase subunit 2
LFSRNTIQHARVLVASLWVLAFTACTGGTEYVQTTFHPVTEYGEVQNAVFRNTFWWTLGILVLVIVLLLFVVVRFREKPGAPQPKQIHGNTKLELLWTIVPAIIVVLIGVPTVQAIFETQRRPAADALTIEVIGHQWWWEFNYPELGVRTANLFYLPVGRTVHFQLNSADVIHSFWVPRLGGKRDVFPLPRTAEGERTHHNHIVLQVDSAGTYRGQCAEFCGESHAIMAITAVAVPQAEFDAWVASMRHVAPAPVPADAAAPQPDPGAPQGAADPLVEEGRRIFLSRACIACHAISNTTAQGRVGPDLTRFALRPTVGAGARPNTQENIEAWIRDPRALKPGALMPGAQVPAGAFPPTSLSDEEIRAVAAYLRSLN